MSLCRHIRGCGFAAGLLILAATTGVSARGQDFTIITSPIQVPLHWRHIDGSASAPRKLGIYATLGGAVAPQLFEFDTGGAGFFATYSTGTASPWWGSGWTATSGTFSQSYDSGITYSGTSVTTTVRLFADSSAPSPLLSASDVVVGQTIGIDRAGYPTLWPLPSAGSPPPVEGAFYGDFGMAPKQGQAGIDSLAGQFLYGAGVTAGFRVHASDENPWVQFGLTDADLTILPTTFSMNVDTGTSPAGVPYYQSLIVSGSLSVVKDNAPFDQATGFIFDTGAFTTIHNAAPNDPFPAHLTKDHAGTEVVHGAHFVASGISLQPGLFSEPFLDFTTGGVKDVDRVDVQYKADDPIYYVNTGILPFTQNDVVYNLGSGRLTVIPVPEPSTGVLGMVGAGLVWLLRRRRR